MRRNVQLRWMLFPLCWCSRQVKEDLELFGR
ncbi:hypothetical protein BOH78_3834 [Pichia kudriavzevii]|uniref:Uncharacterized protein n=1 Tax=Pichia kudriavzevii TaxID=4909 RepID=A0A1V2LLE8_PICKU|nr:hypothetical protein BOH78_3834 [Pichia kudriavzevii]